MRQLLGIIAFLWVSVVIFGGLGESSSAEEAAASGADPGVSAAGYAGSGGGDRTVASSAGKLVLTRESDGHFYADVKINSATIRMLVDTGASGIALTVRDAKRARAFDGVDTDTAVGQGAGGAVYGGFTALDRVKLGKVTAHDVPAVVIEGGDLSLLGQSFLREFRSVKIEDDRMILTS